MNCLSRRTAPLGANRRASPPRRAHCRRRRPTTGKQNRCRTMLDDRQSVNLLTYARHRTGARAFVWGMWSRHRTRAGLAPKGMRPVRSGRQALGSGRVTVKLRAPHAHQRNARARSGRFPLGACIATLREGGGPRRQLTQADDRRDDRTRSQAGGRPRNGGDRLLRARSPANDAALGGSTVAAGCSRWPPRQSRCRQDMSGAGDVAG